MYRIEYYTRRGGFICPVRFKSFMEAHKYARRRFDRLGATHYVVLTDTEF